MKTLNIEFNDEEFVRLAAMLRVQTSRNRSELAKGKISKVYTEVLEKENALCDRILRELYKKDD